MAIIFAQAGIQMRTWPRDAAKFKESTTVDTNTLLIIIVVIFLFGGFGWYGRGRWY